MKKTILFSAMCAIAVCLFSTAAAADSYDYSYPCDLVFYPNSGGDYGKLLMQMYTEPNCSGTYERSLFVYSDGYTSDDSTYYYSEAQLMALYRQLFTAIVEGWEVYYRYDGTQLKWLLLNN